MSSEKKINYKLTIDFKSDERNSRAFYDALAQICDAWSRHLRIIDPVCDMNEIKSNGADSQKLK